jgi:hypothetical protein
MISAYGFVYLSNGDKLHCNKRWGEKHWIAEYKLSQYAQRLCMTTFREALTIYEERTGNCLVGILDAKGIQDILNKQVSWKPLNT